MIGELVFHDEGLVAKVAAIATHFRMDFGLMSVESLLGRERKIAAFADVLVVAVRVSFVPLAAVEGCVLLAAVVLTNVRTICW